MYKDFVFILLIKSIFHLIVDGNRVLI